MYNPNDDRDPDNPGGQVIPPDWFDQNAPSPAQTTPPPAASTSGTDFGNLSDPRVWDALVGDRTRLMAWIKAQNPGWPDQLVGYYADTIQKQPGINDTEKAGSANYYITEKFKKDPFYTGYASGGTDQQIPLGQFGSLAQGWGKDFVAPTADEIRATPGYQFARDEGISALDKAAAAHGTLNNGGQKKDIMEFATGLADQTAHQKYLDYLGEYQQAYGIFRNNSNDLFDRFNQLSTRGFNAANSATS